jgi:2-hydroxy-6-oxonona-2,4-dienedioate hydrolase
MQRVRPDCVSERCEDHAHIARSEALSLLWQRDRILRPLGSGGAHRTGRFVKTGRRKTLTYPTQEAYGYQYLDEGPATDLPPVVLLYGLLGDVTNWTATVGTLTARGYRVLVPVLPVYDLPPNQSNLHGLVEHVRGFVETLRLAPIALAGNSLGGQLALLYTLGYPERVAALILTGSSGIFEVETGTTTIRRRDRNFIRERAALSFFDPVHVTDNLVEKSYTLFNDRNRALRILQLARSSQAETVTDQLAHIATPTLLVWGRNDRITPPDVAEAFLRHLPCAELYFIDRCGHAPMIERPEAFNRLALAFLHKTIGLSTLTSTGITS